MANRARGEIPCLLGDLRLVLYPEYFNLVELEDLFDCPVALIIDHVPTMRARQIVEVLHIGCHTKIDGARRETATPDVIGEALPGYYHEATQGMLGLLSAMIVAGSQAEFARSKGEAAPKKTGGKRRKTGATSISDSSGSPAPDLDGHRIDSGRRPRTNSGRASTTGSG